MGSPGLIRARDKMLDAGVDPLAVETFAHYYRLLEHGETGMIPESSIEPVDMPALSGVEVADDDAAEAVRTTAVIKLNGGLGTSMGMERAKSLLCVRRGLSFLDIIARQVLHLRKEYDATLPLIFMNSFRTSADTMAALARYDDLAVDGLPLEFLQNKEPKLLAKDLSPVCWPEGPRPRVVPARPRRPLHRAARHRPARPARGRRLPAGVRLQLRQPRRRAGRPGRRLVRRPRVRRSRSRRSAGRPSDRKGGHFARRTSDGRIVLRETAQTLKQDLESLADLERHRFCSTNNLWFDLAAMKHALDVRGGILGLPLIRNVKTVDPADKSTPEVIQVETAMGAAIEVFEDSALIEVGRDRFVPVKTTNDLMVLRSDVYDIGPDFALDQAAAEIPFVELDGDVYKLVAEFDKRFPDGTPSMKKASSLKVAGDWTFGHGVQVVGDVELAAKSAQRVADDTVLSGDASS